MAKIMSNKKLSKKTAKKLSNQNRVTWQFNPATRRVENKKRYNRKKSFYRFDDYGEGFFNINKTVQILKQRCFILCYN